MPNLTLADLSGEIQANVRAALAEDIGSGDITAQLIPAEREAQARVITREDATVAGTAWVDEVFRQIDPRVQVQWQVRDGERVSADQTLFSLQGPARALLSGERSALNFFQLLSGTATRARHYADLVEGVASVFGAFEFAYKRGDAAEAVETIRKGIEFLSTDAPQELPEVRALVDCFFEGGSSKKFARLLEIGGKPRPLAEQLPGVGERRVGIVNRAGTDHHHESVVVALQDRVDRRPGCRDHVADRLGDRFVLSHPVQLQEEWRISRRRHRKEGEDK